jgi:protein-S-isoprenylcysteine O-methyltransferase Ste14
LRALKPKEENVENKRWWESKTVWANIVIVVVATITTIDVQFGTGLMQSPTVQAILAVLGVIGIYGRVTAHTEIK